MSVSRVFARPIMFRLRRRIASERADLETAADCTRPEILYHACDSGINIGGTAANLAGVPVRQRNVPSVPGRCVCVWWVLLVISGRRVIVPLYLHYVWRVAGQTVKTIEMNAHLSMFVGRAAAWAAGQEARKRDEVACASRCHCAFIYLHLKAEQRSIQYSQVTIRYYVSLLFLIAYLGGYQIGSCPRSSCVLCTGCSDYKPQGPRPHPRARPLDAGICC